MLSHRAGVPQVPGSKEHPPTCCSTPQSSRASAARCQLHPPGKRLEYHALSGGYLLGAVVQQATGRSLQEVIRAEILDPLGFDLMGYGVPRDREPDVAVNYVTGRAMPLPINMLTSRALGVRPRARTSPTNPRFYREILPSANVIGTADEASRFFEMLLRGGVLDGKRVLEERTLHAACVETAYMELDRVLLFPVRYGQGLMLGAPLISPFGLGLGRTFGHLGFMNVFCYADPERDIAVSLMTTGKILFDTHLPALVQVLWRIARDCAPVPAR